MFKQAIFHVVLATGTLVAQSAQPAQARADLEPFFNRIWRIDAPLPSPKAGGIYIFLRNGTLLETSCVETYRIATWKTVPAIRGQLIVTEDGRPAFTVTVATATAQTLSLRQVMMLGDRSARNMTLTAIVKEFVCPDLPK